MKLLVFINMLRPTQWLKNLMIFFPPLLAGQILLPGLLARGIAPFSAFCLVSSAGYILNDFLDRTLDARHPKKRLRPIPSGAVNIFSAKIILFLLLIVGLILAALTSSRFLLLLLLYFLISASYSLFFKALPLIDIFCISAGFLVRIQAGGELFKIPISPWLFLTVFLLSVFLSTGKRLGELRSLGDKAGEHRASLAHYPPGFLDGTMYMTGAAVLVTYAIYSLNKQMLIYTVPLCFFGLLRYMFRVSSGRSGDPTESLLKDGFLFAVGLMWLLMVIWSLYL